jgi:hypothetical protein
MVGFDSRFLIFYDLLGSHARYDFYEFDARHFKVIMDIIMVWHGHTTYCLSAGRRR